MPAPALMPSLPIRTERLLLRAMRQDDADAMVVYKSLPDVCRYVPFDPMDRPAMDEWIARRLRTELTEVGTGITLSVEEATTGQLAGDVVIIWHSAEHRTGEIGYVFDPAYSGRGYATEACRELLRIGFEEFGWHRILARLDVRNDASAKVCRRLGMRREAELREDEWFKGEWSTTVIYAMLEDEWRAARTSGTSRSSSTSGTSTSSTSTSSSG